MNEWMNEWMNESMNKSINQPITRDHSSPWQILPNTAGQVTLNNASDYRTNGHYRTPNPSATEVFLAHTGLLVLYK